MKFNEKYQKDMEDAKNLSGGERAAAEKEAWKQYTVGALKHSGDSTFALDRQRETAEKLTPAVIQFYSGRMGRATYLQRRINDGAKHYAKELNKAGVLDMPPNSFFQDYADRSIQVEDILFGGRTDLSQDDLKSLCDVLYAMSQTIYREMHKVYGKVKKMKDNPEDYIWRGV